VLTAANVHDSKVLEEAVHAIEPIKRPRGRPRKRPKKLHADKGYDFPRCRKVLRKSDLVEEGHNPTHRPTRSRLEREIGAAQVGCGAYAGVAGQVSQAGGAL
jgi:IS5 family transposase